MNVLSTLPGNRYGYYSGTSMATPHVTGVAALLESRQPTLDDAQLQAHIEELAQSYEKPGEVMRWYLSDRNRMAEVEAVVVENNVANHVLERARSTPKTVPFDELMAG